MGRIMVVIVVVWAAYAATATKVSIGAHRSNDGKIGRTREQTEGKKAFTMIMERQGVSYITRF